MLDLISIILEIRLIVVSYHLIPSVISKPFYIPVATTWIKMGPTQEADLLPSSYFSFLALFAVKTKQLFASPYFELFLSQIYLICLI
jgi:hypothetical protein